MSVGGSRPITDHEMELFNEGLDFLEIFAAPLVRLEIQRAAKGDHVAQVANLGWGDIWIFGLLEHCIPELGQLSFDAGGIDLDRFTKRFPHEIELLGERLHW